MFNVLFSPSLCTQPCRVIFGKALASAEVAEKKSYCLSGDNDKEWTTIMIQINLSQLRLREQALPSAPAYVSLMRMVRPPTGLPPATGLISKNLLSSGRGDKAEAVIIVVIERG